MKIRYFCISKSALVRTEAPIFLIQTACFYQQTVEIQWEFATHRLDFIE